MHTDRKQSSSGQRVAGEGGKASGVTSVWSEEVLEVEGGDGCTTLWKYLMPMN